MLGKTVGLIATLILATAIATSASAQDEEGSTPGAIPNPGTYQGSMDLQRQQQQQDEQTRQQYQPQQQPYQQPQYRQPQSGGAQQPRQPQRLRSRGPVLSGGQAQKGTPADDAAHAALNRGDWVAAVRLWRALAEHGDLDAQYNLGVMYDLGHGIAMNSGSAFRWYRKAADKGLGVAMGNLGNCYALGKGTRPDLVQAFKWYTLAIDHVGQEQRAASTSNRNLVAGHMTRLQIAEGFMLARAWAAH